MPPAHEPTTENKMKVMAWAGAGFTQSAMSYHLGITEKTLRAHYRKELDEGKELANSYIAGKLFFLAASGDFQAMRFYLQCQAQWKTTHEVDVKGKMSFSEFVAQCGDLDDLDNADADDV